VSASTAATAGGFLYIALADLVPSLHHPRPLGRAQIALIVLGAGTIWLMREAIHIG